MIRQGEELAEALNLPFFSGVEPMPLDVEGLAKIDCPPCEHAFSRRQSSISAEFVDAGLLATGRRRLVE